MTGPGTYPIGEGTPVQEIGTGVIYGGNLTGTVTIATFNLGQQKADGTFSFRATRSLPTPGTNAVEVTNGTFNISTIVQLP